MSDSDVDLLPNNVFTFQNENTIVSARGPNINASNLTGLSFRNNILTSTMNMPRNFERQKYLEQSYDQRSMHYRRDSSPPMSLHSASSFRPRNYQHMYYPRGMSSQRSMINGRSGSPMSVRSIDSNATVSAVDIAMAFKNINFNNYDVRLIKGAYNQFMKKRMRRKIEKRRNLRLFMKGHRRRSGYDSGDLGSDSSISSDDCRSMRTAHTSVFRDNMSSCRSTKTDFSDLRRTVKEGNLYKDCTESFRQKTFKNMLGVPPRNANAHTQTRVQNEPSVTQKDRFKNGFLLPSQRFNQSVASVPIPEKQDRLQVPNRDIETRTNTQRNSRDLNLESEQEEIFSEITIREKSVCNADIERNRADPRKRCLEVDDVRPNNKRSKLSSPTKKNLTEVTSPKEINNITDKNSNEFQFLKPQFPVRKSGNIKVKEKLLAKSAEPLFHTVISTENAPEPQTLQPHCDQNNEQTESSEQQSDLASTSDVSMRPSFIKRKLYTQKFDVLESKNTSNDNLASPQTNVYSAIQKEKHKARKLVTNQSCLSRDVREDNNLLDLIHKIVPPDRMNVTSVTNKSETANISTKNKPDDDKWDITSVITTCNNDDVSDTYTDEEIFINESSKKQVNNQESSKTNKKNVIEKTVNVKLPSNSKPSNDKTKESPIKKKKESPIKKKKASPNKKKSPTERKSPSKIKSPCEKKKNCQVLVEKLPVNKALERAHKKAPVPEKLNNKEPITEKITKPSFADEPRDENQGKLYNCVKSFWDTDFESDVEGVPSAKKVKEKENNINQGNITLKERSNFNQSSKTKDITQSKFVWNSNSKPAVTLKSHSFSNHVKSFNANKSFTKRTNENMKEKKNSEMPQSNEKQIKSIEQPKKAPSKKIVLDTYNSTVSDNTQNETVLNANNKSRAPREKKNENMKKNGDPINKKDMPKTQVPEKNKLKLSNATPEKTKSTTVNNAKPQSKQVVKIASKRSPASPKEFTCCKEPANKKSKIETIPKTKTNKTVLENNNSTLSDNTLDEIIKKGNRTRALRATRMTNLKDSISDDLRRDDSQMLNMTLRSRQLNASIVKGKNKKTTVPTRAEEKARNTSKNSQTKDTQSKPNETLSTPVKGSKTKTKKSGKKNSPKSNNKVKSTSVHKRAIKPK